MRFQTGIVVGSHNAAGHRRLFWWQAVRRTMTLIWIALLAVTRLTMESSNDDWMNCIDDPKRLRTRTAFSAAIARRGSARGSNKDAHDAGERQRQQHCRKVSRTVVHYVLHLLVRRMLVD